MPDGARVAVPEGPRDEGARPDRREAYTEAVLDLVEAVPAGRATTYGAIADALVDGFGGGPRQVGTALARAGAAVPWWRVVNAAGRPPVHDRAEALARLREEGCPLSDDGCAADPEARVVLRRALWWPAEEERDDRWAGVGDGQDETEGHA